MESDSVHCSLTSPDGLRVVYGKLPVRRVRWFRVKRTMGALRY
jgi:hypothetical protein